MSNRPSWEIIPPPAEQRALPIGIKYPIAMRYMDHDGSLVGEVILNIEDVHYLEGLRDGSDEDSDAHIGAVMLIKEIRDRGQIMFVISE